MFVTPRTILANKTLSQILKLLNGLRWLLDLPGREGLACFVETRQGLLRSVEGLRAPGEGGAASHGEAPELAVSASGCVFIHRFKAFLVCFVF